MDPARHGGGDVADVPRVVNREGPAAGQLRDFRQQLRTARPIRVARVMVEFGLQSQSGYIDLGIGLGLLSSDVRQPDSARIPPTVGDDENRTARIRRLSQILHRDVRLGDEMNGYLAEENVSSTGDIVPWVQEAIAYFYPHSTYAKSLDPQTRDRAARRLFRPPISDAELRCPDCGVPHAAPPGMEEVFAFVCAHCGKGVDLPRPKPI
jgi:hypothetical protein